MEALGKRSILGKDRKMSTPDSSETTAASSVFVCPMQPEVRQDEPGNCPKCGMHLVPESELEVHSAHDHHEHHGKVHEAHVSVHKEHKHGHGLNCGHKTRIKNGLVEYKHGEHWHHQHGDHMHESHG